MKRNTIKKEAKEISDADREQFKKDWKMLAGRLKGSKPKGQKEFDAFKKKPVDESPSSVECDGCGKIVHDDDVEIVGDQVLCHNCRSKYYRKPGYWQESKKVENWMGIPGARHIWNGSWSDPEIAYKGFNLNYWDVMEIPYEDYRQEHPEDKDEKGFDEWFAKQDPAWIEGLLEDMVYAYTGDIDGPEWLGIEDAYLLKDYKTDEDYVFYKGYRIELDNIADTCGFYDANDYEFEEFIKKAESNKQLKKQVQSALDKIISRDSLYQEGLKEMWGAVKNGAKNIAKKVGNFFKGPFRKGDQIVMKGEAGQEFKGTIKGFDKGEKTYEVLLGNAVNEGLQEDVLNMPDRPQEIESQLKKNEEELYNMLSDEYKDNEYKFHHHSKFDELLEERDALVEELCGCRGLMKEETREERAYLRSIGEYDGYLGKKKPAKRKWGGASKKSVKKPVRKSPSRPAAKKYKYSFSASGYGTKTYSFPSEEECLKEMKQDAEATAAEYNGEVQWWDDKECVVVDGDGQELGTFEYLGARR